MKKYKKSILSLGTLGVAIAPIAAAVSCGTNGQYDKKVLLVQAEKSWVPAYEKIINNFKKNHKDDMSKAGISDIKIKEMGSFDVEKAFSNKGLRDKDTPDLFVLAGDKMNFYQTNSFLAPFQEKNVSDFEKNNLEANAEFLAATKSLQDIFTNKGKIYAVPENVESMVKYYTGSTAPSSTVTRFSDLWMSAGYFNTKDFNLKDIVWSDKGVFKTIWDNDTKTQGHESIKDEKEANDAIKAGFENIINASKGITNEDAFDKDSSKAAPKILDYAASKTAGVFGGPYDKKDIQTAFSNKSVSPHEIDKKDNWMQWAGGWGYALNARRMDQESVIKLAENLIGDLLKSTNAEEIYKYADKISPTNKGEAILKSATDSKDMASAIYGTVTHNLTSEKPTDVAFNQVWGAYSKTVSAKANDLIANTRKASLAQDLTDSFIAEIKANIKTENDKNNA